MARLGGVRGKVGHQPLLLEHLKHGEARRLIKGGGARINDTAAPSETRTITLADLNADGVIKLSAGKKRHALVRPI